MQNDDWFPLAELTGRIGGLVWVEEQLADTLAGWSRVESHAPSTVYFATAGGHHRWHSEILRACLPTSPRLREPEVVRAPTAGWEKTMVTMREMADPDATDVRLKSLAKIVDPWIDREIGALLDLSRPVSDAALARWLRFITLDHHDDGDAGASLLTARASSAVRFDDHLLIQELNLD